MRYFPKIFTRPKAAPPPNPVAAKMQYNGGAYNNSTGMGSWRDRSEGTYWYDSAYSTRQLRTVYNQSWIAKKLVDLPATAMTAKWREWKTSDQDKDARLNLELLERQLHVQDTFREAMQRARLYGGSLIIMRVKDNVMDMPLDLRQIRKGDLVGLTVVDQQTVYHDTINYRVLDENYGEPEYYYLYSNGTPVRIHASRTLRFDGEKALTEDGRSYLNSGWGMSALVKIMHEINSDASFRSGITHLMNQTSLLILKSSGMGEVLQAMQDPNYKGEDTAKKYFENMERMISIYNMMLADSEGGIERLAVNWAGIDKIIDHFLLRLCAASSIPATIFLGRSPQGLNASGEGENWIWSDQVRAWQESHFDRPLSRLDPILGASAGIMKMPQYTWRPYFNKFSKDTQNAEVIMKALSLALSNGLIDEDEGRSIIDGTPIFGTLSGPAPGFPNPL